jgi:hypothetical protein
MNLELHCNLVHSVVTRMITDDRKFKFGLKEAYATCSPEKLLGTPTPMFNAESVPKITIVPDGHIFSLFEFPSYLSLIRHIPAILNCSLNELITVHHPSSPSAESALHAALLEKCISMWVDMECQINTKNLQTIQPNVIMENPIKMSNDVESYLVSLDSLSAAVTPKSVKITNELSAPFNNVVSVLLYTHALELVRLRYDLLINHFFVMHLCSIYKSQAEV